MARNKPLDGEEAKERIWRIRDSIQKLEDVKDKIIDFLDSSEDLDDSTKAMWMADAKEVYYNIVAAWEMLRAVSEDEKEDIDSCRHCLEMAKSRLEQSSSELRGLSEAEALQLEVELRRTFETCCNEISVELAPFSGEKETKRPLKEVIVVSDSVYQLPCSVCGEIAAVFRIGTSTFEKEENFIFDGITHSQSLGLKHSERIFRWLEKKDISKVHYYVREKGLMEDGIDAYCPDCDKIYCGEHYDVREEWDHGFYDCSYGTCPEGHKRIIDD